MLRRVTRSRGILLTTYGMVLHNAVALARDPAQGSTGSTAAGEPLWDVMILDEASGSWITLPCSIISLWCHGCLFNSNVRVVSHLGAVPMHSAQRHISWGCFWGITKTRPHSGPACITSHCLHAAFK